MFFRLFLQNFVAMKIFPFNLSWKIIADKNLLRAGFMLRAILNVDLKVAVAVLHKHTMGFLKHNLLPP